MRARNTASNKKSPSSSRSAPWSPRSSASSSSYVSSSTNGRSDWSVCSRSHGQPSEPRSVRMMSTSRSNRWPAVSVIGAIRYGTIGFVSASDDRPEVSFVAFIFSLASNAAVHFGDLPDPMTNEKRPPDLEAAAQLIDLLAMLEEKTRGNLSAEERQLLDQAIFELRMRYVEAKKAQSPIIQP